MIVQKNNKKRFQVNLSSYILVILILFSLTPPIVFYFVTQNMLVSELSRLEEEEQLYKLGSELNLLKTKFDTYKSMIDFLSQLPAVFEILDEGKELNGSINQDISIKRYTGVLNRAFANNEDVISINILI